MAKKPNISGIIHCIILVIDFWRGSALGVAIIFCCIHIEPPTSRGNRSVLSGWAKFSHRKFSPKGTVR